MQIKPLHDRVVVKRVEPDMKSQGGIIIPDTAKEKPVRGIVVAVGPGKRTDTGKLVVPDVAPGDQVLFGRYAGTEMTIEGEEHVMLREDEILAVVEKKS